MSLINDALRRASQTERNRPRHNPSPVGMEPAPVTRGSRLSLLLISTMFVSLLLACWCFWQWWAARKDTAAHVPRVATAPATIPLTPPVVAARPVAVAAAPPVPATVAPAKPVPPPAAVVDVPPPVVQHPAAAPPEIPLVSNYTPTPWPVDLKLNAVFYSKTNPRVLLNGNIYTLGDNIQGVILKKIDVDKITVEWDGRTRVIHLPTP
jgi:hypothetical protein